jgi:conjugal transfer pilus assembly protein TraA
MTDRKTRLMVPVLALACVALVMSVSESHAGTAGTEFSAIWTTLSGWISGVLGRIVTTAMVLTGIGAAIARQSLMPFAVGVGGGLGLAATPTTMGLIFGATLIPSLPAATLAVQPVLDLAQAVLAIH